jgi:hypothetical protein
MIGVVDVVLERVQDDLQDPSFVDGVARGRWRVADLSWPYLTVGITAGLGGELGMRINLEDFPAQAPAGIPWNLSGDRPAVLSELPTGGIAEQVFRSGWSQVHQLTPYMATERLVTMPGEHPEWLQQYPSRAWNAGRKLSFYMQQLSIELRQCTVEAIAV